MRRVWTFVAVWVGLFAVTAGVRLLSLRAESRRDPGTQAVDAKLHELELLPRKSSGSPLSESDGGVVADFDSQLSSYVLAHDAGLRRCRTEIMKKSSSPKEYFEVSFIARTAASAADKPSNGRQLAQLDELVFERSTVQLSPDEKRCIIDEFGLVNVAVAEIPKYRIFYKFCFGALH